MNINDIVILGLLAEMPRHGYEIKKEVEERGLNDWASVKIQSIYNRLKVLEKEGYISLDTVKKQGNMPEKSIYKIEASGYLYLHNQIIEALGIQGHRTYHDSFVAMGFMIPVLSDEIVKAIENLYNHFQSKYGTVENKHAAPELPLNWKILIECGAGHINVARKTVGEILQAIKDGRIIMGDKKRCI
ncbi:MAG: PadR family transcriptional regulator [bacterium]